MLGRVCDARNGTLQGLSPRYIRSGPREMAASPVRATSTRPSGCISAMNCSIFDCLPVISKTKCSVEASMTWARKASARRNGLDPLLALAGDLDHGELALDRVALHRQVGDRVDRHQPLELMLDLLDHHAAGPR